MYGTRPPGSVVYCSGHMDVLKVITAVKYTKYGVDFRSDGPGIVGNLGCEYWLFVILSNFLLLDYFSHFLFYD